MPKTPTRKEFAAKL